MTWIKTHWPGILFFSFYLCLGVNIIGHYGMSWDEAVQRRHGLVALDNIIETFELDWKKFAPDGYTKSYPSKYYPVMFSMACGGMERLFGVEEDFVNRYYLRHCCIFLVFWVSMIVFYGLLFRITKNTWLGLLGVLFIILHPRIFAHSFFNPKDIILLSFYIFGIYTLFSVLNKPSTANFLIHGIVCGLAINTRMPAVFLPAVTMLLLAAQYLLKPGHISLPKLSLGIFLFLLATGLTTFTFFPYLWENGPKRASEAFQTMANYPWGAENLFLGQYIPGNQLPWYYIPAWIGISTPITYLLLFLIGVLFLIRNLIIKYQQVGILALTSDQTAQLVFLSLVIGPYLAVAIFQSTLYNGWRHLYFIYPAMAAMMLFGFKSIINFFLSNKKVWFLSLTVVVFIPTLINMVKIHPHQQVYFNKLAGKNRLLRYDMDYWGVSYRQALMKISDENASKRVKVRCANYPCEDNFRYLPARYRENVELVWQDSLADLYLSNFRRKAIHEAFLNKTPPYDRPVFFIEVDKEPIIGVFELN